ncbi:MAG: response regulator [Spirochaetales bacterium]
MTSTTPPKKILIAEDVESLANLMRFLLEEEGFTVETVPDGEACLLVLGTFKPDLLLLDIMMPKVHGLEIIRIVKAFHQTRNIGVIVCTAKDYKTDRDRIEALGVSSFISKPFEPRAFVEVVRNFFSPDRVTEPHAEVLRQPLNRATYQPQIDRVKSRITLWGTRGSTPVSHPRYIKHGGNTPCLSVQAGDAMIILDAGTGIRELGQWLLKSPVRKVHLFIGHTHWDHIQGFPFFAPAFDPGFELHIYGAAGFGKNLKSVFQGQLDQDYFPVQLEDMRAKMEFHVLKDTSVKIGGLEVHWEFVNHPGAAVGFKLVSGNRSLAYITDNEFLEGFTGSPVGLTRNHPSVLPYRPIIDFVTGVDLLIHEAQYTPADYPAKITWGHSSLSNAALLAHLGEVKQWIITHHDPSYDDVALDENLLLTRQILDELGSSLPVSHAYDGLDLLL